MAILSTTTLSRNEQNTLLATIMGAKAVPSADDIVTAEKAFLADAGVTVPDSATINRVINADGSLSLVVVQPD